MHPAIKKALDQAGISYREIVHEALGVPIAGPADVAQALAISLERITKTLFWVAKEPCFAVLSSSKRLDRTAVSTAAGAPCHAASRDKLEQLVGYPPGSVSPLGTRDIPVFIDCDLLVFPTVLVGGGELGVEIELCPADLVRLTAATVLPLTR